MSSKVMMMAVAAMAGLMSQSSWGAPPSQEADQAALAQCVALRTTGADRIVTARWLFAVMAKSPQIVDLSAVTTERTKQLNQEFAKLLTRVVTKDCIDQVRPIAAVSTQDAFEQVGQALGETAMKELMSGKEVDKGLAAYSEYLSEDDFKPLVDSLPKKSK